MEGDFMNQDHAARTSMSWNASTSMSPRSVSFRLGITGSDKNASWRNGSGSTQPIALLAAVVAARLPVTARFFARGSLAPLSLAPLSLAPGARAGVLLRGSLVTAGFGDFTVDLIGEVFQFPLRPFEHLRLVAEDAFGRLFDPLAEVVQRLARVP